MFRRSYGTLGSSEYLCNNDDDDDDSHMELQDASGDSFSVDNYGIESRNDQREIRLNPQDLDPSSKPNSEISILLDRGLTGGLINRRMTQNENNENESLVHSNGTTKSNSGINYIIPNKGKVAISRDAIDWDDLNSKYGKRELKRTPLIEKCCRIVKNKTSECSFLGYFLSLFPFITWIRCYSIKDYFVSDLIAGFTVAILHIPQGMAYGILAGVGPIYGLYVSFFPVLIYCFMGTSRHISIGTFAVVSIMLSNTLVKVGAVTYEEEHGNNTQSAFTLEEMESRPKAIEVLTSLCLLSGAFQLLLGSLHLGVLSVILSDTLVSAFSTGCAFHVATSQLSHLFDITLPETKTGPFQLIRIWINLVKSLKNTNVASLIVSICAILILVIVKEFFEPWIKKKFALFKKLPIPIDIILVIGVTFLSSAIGFNEKYGIQIMKKIPKGLPLPKIPRFDLMPDIIVDAIVISIVAYTVCLSLGKIYAKKHKYIINANQELNALGISNIISSFFSCYTCAVSLSRSSVQEKIGGKTQMAGIISSFLMLFVLLFLGPLLYNLPKCILASIILVALKPLFVQMTDMIKAWRISRLEGFTWGLTLISVILLGVDIGLIAGIGIAIFVVLLRFAMPSSYILGNLPYSEVYVDTKVYDNAMEIPSIKIYNFSCALFFINCQSFKSSFYRKTLNVKSDEIDKLKHRKLKIRTIIIDCSSISYIDSTGVETIVEIIDELKDFNIRVCIASCGAAVISKFERTKFFERIENPFIYPSVHDAVVQNITSDDHIEI